MTPTVVWARVALVAVGVLIWSYGVRADDSTIRLIGIGFLVAAVALRFVRRRPPAA